MPLVHGSHGEHFSNCNCVYFTQWTFQNRTFDFFNPLIKFSCLEQSLIISNGSPWPVGMSVNIFLCQHQIPSYPSNGVKFFFHLFHFKYAYFLVSLFYLMTVWHENLKMCFIGKFMSRSRKSRKENNPLQKLWLWPSIGVLIATHTI